MIRVLVVDDHAIFRRGLANALADAGLDVAGQAASADEAVRLVRQVAPDVVLMDLHMPGGDGVEATRAIAGSTCVLVLTVSGEDEDLVRAIGAGASGYLLKNVGPDELVQAIRAVAAGDSVLSPEVTGTALAALRDQRHRSRLDQLSTRERAVLAGIARGLSNRGIADELGISEHTVKTYVERIYDKLGVRSRAQAAAIAGDPETR